MPLDAGTHIGAYVIESLLGRGGMAEVYRATQVRLQRAVALKVLLPALSTEESFVQRFQLEGVNASRLEHPHIVPVYDAGEDGHRVFIAMKLIDGTTLKDAAITRTDEIQRVLGGVGTALDYAHGLGFVHRDVKPANILIDRTGHVYLSDFGLTKAVGSTSITSTGQWMGTPEYMPPEQAAGGHVDHRADLYSFACVAYELLTGQAPFTGDSPLSVMIAHTQKQAPDPTVFNLSLPPGVDVVLRRALEKQPQDRYASAAAFLDALQAALEERRLTASGEPAGATEAAHAPPAAPHAPTGPAPSMHAPPEHAPPGHTPAVHAQPVEQTPVHAAPVEQPSYPATSTVCPVCMGRLAYGYSFCGDCGSRIMWCGRCSGPVVHDDRFCQHCGAQVI